MAKVSPINFFRQVRQEIAKVSWPTRKEVIITSVMVFIISVLAAIFFLMVDGSIAFLINLILS